jgi:hypothetical protein
MDIVLWEPPTLNQVLANQSGPQQLQHPLVCAPLATTYKDADLWHVICQSQSRNHPLLCSGGISIVRSAWFSVGWSPQYKNPVILSVTHHCQNPSESISYHIVDRTFTCFNAYYSYLLHTILYFPQRPPNQDFFQWPSSTGNTSCPALDNSNKKHNAQWDVWTLDVSSYSDSLGGDRIKNYKSHSNLLLKTKLDKQMWIKQCYRRCWNW